MSANSPTYACDSGGTPNIVNTDQPYCIVPHGHKRMDVCCSRDGDGSVHFKPDCYSWCNIRVADGGEYEGRNLRNAADLFTDCLAHGTNSSDPGAVVCGYGLKQSQSGTTVIISETSSSPTSTEDAGATVTSSKDVTTITSSDDVTVTASSTAKSSDGTLTTSSVDPSSTAEDPPSSATSVRSGLSWASVAVVAGLVFTVAIGL